MNVSRKLRCFAFASVSFDGISPRFCDRPLSVFVTTFLPNPSTYCYRNQSRFLSETTTRRLTMNRQTDKKQAGKFPPKEFAGAGARARGTRATILEDEVRAEREKFLSMPLDKKRKLYRCGDDRCMTLKDIPRWPEYPLENKKGPASPRKVSKTSSRVPAAPKYTVNQEANQRVSLFRGDITALEIDAIVNAANSSLLGGGGVDGAIHGAAGAFLKKECSLLHGCDTGDAKITCGYKLPAKYVIHTVGPMGEKPADLQKAYRRSLEVMQQNQLTSVAFPCISTGIYGYPPESAAHVALATVRQWIQKEAYSDKVERIIFCVFLKKDVEIYEELLPLYFPLLPAPDSPAATGDTHSTPGGQTASGQSGASGREGQVSADGQKTETETAGPKNAALTTEGSGDERPESDTSPTTRQGPAPGGEESMEKEEEEEKKEEKEEEKEEEEKEEEKEKEEAAKEEEEGKSSKRKSKGEQKDGNQEHSAVERKLATKL